MYEEDDSKQALFIISDIMSTSLNVVSHVFEEAHPNYTLPWFGTCYVIGER